MYCLLSLKVSSLMVCLTLYNTIPTFNDPNEEGFGKHCRNRRPAFSPSHTVFSTLTKREIVIIATFDLSSAIAFNLITFKISSFGKELREL